jgi:hypothetical protein
MGIECQKQPDFRIGQTPATTAITQPPITITSALDDGIPCNSRRRMATPWRTLIITMFNPMAVSSDPATKSGSFTLRAYLVAARRSDCGARSGPVCAKQRPYLLAFQFADLCR